MKRKRPQKSLPEKYDEIFLEQKGSRHRIDVAIAAVGIIAIMVIVVLHNFPHGGW